MTLLGFGSSGTSAFGGGGGNTGGGIFGAPSGGFGTGTGTYEFLLSLVAAFVLSGGGAWSRWESYAATCHFLSRV